MFRRTGNTSVPGTLFVLGLAACSNNAPDETSSIPVEFRNAGPSRATQDNTLAEIASETDSIPASSMTQLTARVGVDNYVSIETLPNATCLLRQVGEGGKGLELLSDSRGFVAFYYRPGSAEIVTNDVLDCHDSNGTFARYAVQLQAATDVPVLSAPRLQGPIQPSLKGDPMAVTQQELLDAGYPMRPDPEQEPQAYRTWLSAVTKPTIILPSETVASTTYRNPTYTPNWAGVAAPALSNSAYLAAVAYWFVPSSEPRNTAEGNNSLSFWAGVGGFLGGGMWQGGIGDDWSPGGMQHVRYPWVEFINASGPCCLQNGWNGYPMYEGDDYIFEALFGQSNRYPAITGNDNTQYLWVLQWNVTQGWTTGWQGWTVAWFINQYRDIMKDQSSTIVSGISGNSAEWVVERPQVATNPTTYAVLPDFGWAAMWHVQAFDRASWSWSPYRVRPQRRLYMWDGGTGHLLATGEYGTEYSSYGNGSIDFWWFNYN